MPQPRALLLGTGVAVPPICVDNHMETITKLMDRGTHQAFGLVTDCQFFLKELAARTTTT